MNLINYSGIVIFVTMYIALNNILDILYIFNIYSLLVGIYMTHKSSKYLFFTETYWYIYILFLLCEVFLYTYITHVYMYILLKISVFYVYLYSDNSYPTNKDVNLDITHILFKLNKLEQFQDEQSLQINRLTDYYKNMNNILKHMDFNPINVFTFKEHINSISETLSNTNSSINSLYVNTPDYK